MAIDGGLGKIFREHLPKIHWVRIETMTGRGVPDLNYCGAGKEGWVETKLAKGWMVGLRPEQVAWLMRRHRAGGKVFIAVRRKNKTADQLFIVRGEHAATLLEEGLQGTPCSLLGEGYPVIWDWPAIKEILLS